MLAAFAHLSVSTNAEGAASTARQVGGSIGSVDPALLGAIIGAAGAILGGVLGSFLIVWMDGRRRQRDHADAVRAVLDELAANLRNIAAVQQGGGGLKVGLRDGAYNSLRLQLAGKLPTDVASKVADAYARITITWQAPNPQMRGDAAREAAPALEEARGLLEAYVQRARFRQ